MGRVHGARVLCRPPGRDDRLDFASGNRRSPHVAPCVVQIGLVLVGVIGIGTQRTMVRADEDPRTALRFLQELRDHGLHDLALEFIDELRVDPGLPADLKVVLDYQEGRTEIDEAAKTGDLVHRRELLEQARTKLESFVKAQPNHPLTREAMVQGARMLVERGHLALLLADDSQDPAQKTLQQIEARALFAQAARRLPAPSSSSSCRTRASPASSPRAIRVSTNAPRFTRPSWRPGSSRP